MNQIKIIAIDVESCSVTGKFPKYTDLIIGIGAHTTSSLELNSSFQSTQFIAKELTFDAEEEILSGFIQFLERNRGAILTAYNLMGFDHPILLTRSKEHYPLGFKLIDALPHLSLYDTMIAFKAFIKSNRSCKLLDALNHLSVNGYNCLEMKEKSVISGREILGFWAKQTAGVSTEFSSYLNEDSYNHMRVAQILLNNQIKQGLWSALG